MHIIIFELLSWWRCLCLYHHSQQNSFNIICAGDSGRGICIAVRQAAQARPVYDATADTDWILLTRLVLQSDFA